MLETVLWLVEEETLIIYLIFQPPRYPKQNMCGRAGERGKLKNKNEEREEEVSAHMRKRERKD